MTDSGNRKPSFGPPNESDFATEEIHTGLGSALKSSTSRAKDSTSRAKDSTFSTSFTLNGVRDSENKAYWSETSSSGPTFDLFGPTTIPSVQFNGTGTDERTSTVGTSLFDGSVPSNDTSTSFLMMGDLPISNHTDNGSSHPHIFGRLLDPDSKSCADPDLSPLVRGSEDHDHIGSLLGLGTKHGNMPGMSHSNDIFATLNTAATGAMDNGPDHTLARSPHGSGNGSSSSSDLASLGLIGLPFGRHSVSTTMPPSSSSPVWPVQEVIANSSLAQKSSTSSDSLNKLDEPDGYSLLTIAANSGLNANSKEYVVGGDLTGRNWSSKRGESMSAPVEYWHPHQTQPNLITHSQSNVSAKHGSGLNAQNIGRLRGSVSSGDLQSSHHSSTTLHSSPSHNSFMSSAPYNHQKSVHGGMGLSLSNGHARLGNGVISGKSNRSGGRGSSSGGQGVQNGSVGNNSLIMQEDSSVESTISTCCRDILSEAAGRSLKAVELANTLRARVGTDVLAHIRERWGGLLSLLERHPRVFRVDRVPKNDKVTLLIPISQSVASRETSEFKCTAVSSTNVRGHTTLIEAVPFESTIVSDVAAGSSGSAPGVADSLAGNIVTNSPSTSYAAVLASKVAVPGAVADGSLTSQLLVSQAVGSTSQQFVSPSTPEEIPPACALGWDGKPLPGQQHMTATRCLHVGNVPANLTEAQLAREFDKFGPLEGMKLITQRNGNRRFAFITFREVEHAVTARHCMSKLHPWKSAISFAHKDLSSQQLPTSGAGGNATDHLHSLNVRSGSTNLTAISHKNKSRYGNSEVDDQPGPTISGSTRPQLNPLASDFSVPLQKVSSMHTAGTGGSSGFGYSFAQFTEPASTIQSSSKQVSSGPITTTGIFGAAPQIPQLPAGVEPTTTSPTSAVLRRLCDDTYVPTQLWPADARLDAPFINAAVEQLMAFGGSTTVSKLRGFLRNRVAATDNLKSVPLKAMLAAYPQYFVVQSNYVTLHPSMLNSLTTDSMVL